MNIGEFVLRHGGKIINHYKVDGKDVNEITYKKTEKVKEDVKKKAFLGNIHVTHKAMTQKGLEYKKNCVQKVQKKIDEYIEDGSKFSHELLGHLLLDLGEIKKEKKVDIVGRVFTIEYNDTQYVVSFKFDGEAIRDMHVEKIWNNLKKRRMLLKKNSRMFFIREFLELISISDQINISDEKIDELVDAFMDAIPALLKSKLQAA